MSTTITLRTNLAESPVVKAMIDGRIGSDIVKLDFCGPKVSHDGFKPMLRNEAFQAGELAINTFLQAKAYGKPWVLLPTPLLANFQHHCIAFNSARGNLSPKDIEGGKVGVRMYAQTTGLWVRGILQHEYGVELDKVTWMTSEDAHLAEYQDPSNCQRLNQGSKIAQLLLAGELDAAILSRKDWPDDPRVQRLIPDADVAAQAWYAREGVVPINHVFVMHEDVARKHPNIVREIYRMIQDSRSLAPAAGIAHLPPLGAESNRRGLEMAIRWSFEQKIIPRMLSVDELYDDVSRHLN
jgi:4,5-dihydroxyphthalate decarboxylase